MADYPLPDDICAVITTYRPDDGFSDRVMNAVNQVGFVVIVDDGECQKNVSKLQEWFLDIKNIEVRHNEVNLGLASSLNIGISIAKRRNFKWILTLDDDSLLWPNFIDSLISGLRTIWSPKPIGLIGIGFADSCEVIKGQSSDTLKYRKYREKRGIITSGSLFSMDTYDIVGPFREEFFIDSIDYDYCLRARRKGFAIIKLDQIGFKHSIGRRKIIRLMGLKLAFNCHEPFRIYYWFRNTIVLQREYFCIDPFYCAAALLGQSKKLLTILLLDGDKATKLRLAIRGIRDGLTRNLGKRALPQ